MGLGRGPGRWARATPSVPGGDAYAVAIKSGQHRRRIGDRERQKLSGNVVIAGMLSGEGQAVEVVHGHSLSDEEEIDHATQQGHEADDGETESQYGNGGQREDARLWKEHSQHAYRGESRCDVMGQADSFLRRAFGEAWPRRAITTRSSVSVITWV